MSDLADATGSPRRTPRVSDGGAPVSGALAIVLAVIAVVAGFLILRSISDGGDAQLDAVSDGGGGAGSAPAVAGSDAGDGAAEATTVPTIPPVPTEPPIITQGATVIVANANGQGGSAAAMTRELESVHGFVMVEPVDANASLGDQDTTVVYFDVTNAAAEAVAASVARSLGAGVGVSALPDLPLVAGGDLRGAGVLVLLGTDKANRTLAELNPASGADGATVLTNPPVAGDATG